MNIKRPKKGDWKQFRVTAAMKEEIERVADEEERTQDSLIRLAVRKFLKERREKKA